MKEYILKEIIDGLGEKEKNYYQSGITLDLLEVAKSEMEKISIKFEPYIYKQRERLKIYYTPDDYYNYSKNFYQNNSMFGFKISNDKLMTEKILTYGGVPTTNSKLLNPDQYDEAVEIFSNNTNSKVVKPLNLSGGRGVFMDVTLDKLENTWNLCLNIQKKAKVKSPQLLIQDQIDGFEVRVIVIEGKVFSATLRTPPYVIGDGKKSIMELIKQKNLDRLRNEFFKNKDLKTNNLVTNYLKEKNRSLNDVLDNGELCITYPVSNLMYGGENIVITDLVSRDILDVAKQAVLAIPGLHTAGVDIMADKLQTSTPRVLEVNKAPALQLNYYPFIGEPQSPLKYLFSSLVLEQKILNHKIELTDLEQKDLDLIIDRYRFLYQKQVYLSESIERMLK